MLCFCYIACDVSITLAEQTSTIIKKNKSWFKKEQDENNKKAYKRKLLQGALDFAQAIVDEASKN